MATTIKMWEVVDGSLRTIADTNLADSHVEAELENWIKGNPDILGDRLLIIDQQRDIPGVGRLDLLAVDESGKFVVIELKRDRTSREAVAQALDYASWLDGASAEAILGYADAFLGRPMAEAFFERFQTEMPEISCQSHRVTLVAPRLDAAAERTITYLAERYGVDINAVFFQCARLADGREILARTLLVPEGSRVTPGKSTYLTAEQLLSAAAEQGSRAVAETCRSMNTLWSEEGRTTYGGSFRYWATTSTGKWRMVFGVNAAGKGSPPKGQLDVWIPAPSLAEVCGVSEAAIRASLARFPVQEKGKADCWIRLENAEMAGDLVRHLQGLPRPAPTGAAEG